MEMSQMGVNWLGGWIGVLCGELMWSSTMWPWAITETWTKIYMIIKTENYGNLMYYNVGWWTGGLSSIVSRIKWRRIY